MRLKIPKSFQLHGRTYHVEIVEADDWTEEDCLAFFMANEGHIRIKKQSVEMMEHSYLHELVHAVLNAMGEDKLYKDEAFVDLMGALLHQAFTSAK